ncbi:unnamed protein product [Amoebophrya sp. A120]|nr:unnamed protein product [Amoebophrya sp. A120]|eukprot:GSA120T00005242001.1
MATVTRGCSSSSGCTLRVQMCSGKIRDAPHRGVLSLRHFSSFPQNSRPHPPSKKLPRRKPESLCEDAARQSDSVSREESSTSCKFDKLAILKDPRATAEDILNAAWHLIKSPKLLQEKSENGWIYTIAFEAFSRNKIPWQEAAKLLPALESASPHRASLVPLNALLKQLPLPAAAVLLECRFDGEMGKDLREELLLPSATDSSTGRNYTSSSSLPSSRPPDGVFICKGEELNLEKCFGRRRENVTKAVSGGTTSTSTEAVEGNTTSSPPAAYVDYDTTPIQLVAPDAFTLSTVLQKLGNAARVAMRQREERCVQEGRRTRSCHYHQKAESLYRKYAKPCSADIRCAMQVVRCFPSRAWRELSKFVDHSVPKETQDTHFLGSALDVVARACDQNHQHQEESRTVMLAHFLTKNLDHNDSAQLEQRQDTASSSESSADCSSSHARILGEKSSDDPLLAALKIFITARRRGLANTVVHNAMLLALHKSGRWMEGLELLAHMLQVEENGGNDFATTGAANDSTPNPKPVVDKISFGTVISALPPGEWLLALNLLRKMQDLKMEINTQIAYAVLHNLERSYNLESNQNENSAELLEQQRCLSSGTNSGGRIRVFAITRAGDGDHHGGEGPSKQHVRLATAKNDSVATNKTVSVHGLPRCLLPETILTASVAATGPDRQEAGASWKFFWAPEEGPPQSCQLSPVDGGAIPASMSVIKASTVQIARKMILGPFHPQKTKVPWTEGLFRAGFAFLLDGATNLTHPGWQAAVQLWQTRSADVYPQGRFDLKKLQGIGTGLQPVGHEDTSASNPLILDFHPVNMCTDRSYCAPVVKVCLFCALGQVEKSFGAAASRNGLSSGDLNQTDGGTRSRVTLRLITGKGEARLFRAAVEFLGSVRSVFPSIQTVHPRDAGNIFVTMEKPLGNRDVTGEGRRTTRAADSA